MKVFQASLRSWGLLVTGCMVAIGVQAQRVSVKTNALYWMAASPNVGAEFRLSRHTTLNLEGVFHRMKLSDYNTRMGSFSPEARYWFSARPQVGHFVGVMGQVASYKLSNANTTVNGTTYAVGPTYGYSMVLGRRWSMEATVGAGLGYCRYGKYPRGTMVEEPNHKEWRIVPLKLGLNFVYIIK